MALVLTPEPPLADWLVALDAQIYRSPTFFDARPVVVDLGALAREQTGVGEFLSQLEQRGIRVIGTESAHPSWEGVETWGRPLPGAGKAGASMEAPAASQISASQSDAPQPAAAPLPASGQIPSDNAAPEAGSLEPAALVIDHPVRSGQSIIFERGDITILGSVASGAEVMAGGSVHIYGALRGRAIAGLAGNSKARVFCSKLQAELVAIDGVYLTADDMPANLIGHAIQAWLEGEQMKIAALD
jgi:septum site-determining protein MinC